jgi:hypothetical protein
MNQIGSASIEVNSALGNGELAPTPKQTKQLLQSCTASALADISADDKSALRDIIGKVRQSVVSATDIVKARKNRNRDHIKLLEDQIAKLDSGSGDINTFYKLFSPAVISCADAATTFGNAKSLTDQLFAMSIELQYRLKLKRILDGVLAKEVGDAQQTVADLDNILLLL